MFDSFAYLQLYFTICKYTFTVTNEKQKLVALQSSARYSY